MRAMAAWHAMKACEVDKTGSFLSSLKLSHGSSKGKQLIRRKRSDFFSYMHQSVFPVPKDLK